MFEFKLSDEILSNEKYLNDLEDDLHEAEKICKSYNYDGTFYIDYVHDTVSGFIIANDKNMPEINVNLSKNGLFFTFNINIKSELSWNELNDFHNLIVRANNLCEELNRILISVEIAFYDSIKK